MPLLEPTASRETLRIPLPDPAATERLGAALARLVRRGDVIALHGDLGAGKTTLARALIGALGIEDEVPSPTFTLVQTYSVVARDFEAVWHFDLYRLSSPDEAWELGIEEAFEAGVSLVEWPDRGEGVLPADRLDVSLLPKDNGRTAELAGGASWQGRLNGLNAS